MTLFALSLWLASPAGGVFSGPTEAQGSAIYWNPAAVTRVAQPLAVLSELTAFIYQVGYTRTPLDANAEPDYPRVTMHGIAPDPYLTLAWRSPLDTVRLFGGVFSPTGAGTSWPEDGPQRYFATKSQILVVSTVLGVDWSPIPELSLAASFGPSYGHLRLRNALDFGAFANSLGNPGAELFPYEDPTYQGFSDLHASGWATTAVFGIYAEPVAGLCVGLGFHRPQPLPLHGEVNVEPPAALGDALPAFQFAPHGTFDLKYLMPWILNGEVGLAVGDLSFGVLGQYARKSVQHLLVGRISQADPQFIEGEQLSVKGTHDDWMFGGRATWTMDDTWRFGTGIDFDPRYVPEQTLTPVNLDYTNFEFLFGARYSLDELRAITLTYNYIYLQPTNVTNSKFKPRAPPTSGLNQPSANGRYDGWAHKITLSFEGLFSGS